MKLLFIEDDQNHIAAIRPRLEEDFDVELAESRDAAFSLLEKQTYDLIVCDRKLPAIDGSLDAEFVHGDAIIARARELYPGTPILVNTGFETSENAKALLRESPMLDLYGTGEQFQLYDSFSKTKPDELFDSVGRHVIGLRELADVEVNDGGILDANEKKIITIFARRKSCGLAEVTEISEGLSGAKVFKVIFSGPAGVPGVSTILKIQELEWHWKELEGYKKYVSSLLQSGSYASFIDQVNAGAGARGGLFYRLADENSESLFTLLKKDATTAAQAVESLRDRLEPWNHNFHKCYAHVAEIRQTLLADARMDEVIPFLDGIAYLDFEKRQVLAKRVIGHLDLHGANVLTQTDQVALIIDYGSVGNSFIAVDPIYLELSPIFHPAGCAILGTWPTKVDAQNWPDIDAYTKDCPVPEFIRACRLWASTVAEDRERLASAYAASLAFLRHKDANREIAVEIIKSVIARFDA